MGAQVMADATVNTNITQLIADLGSVITGVIGWIGSVISALFGTNGTWSAMLGFIMLGCACTLILMGVHVIKSLTFGRG